MKATRSSTGFVIWVHIYVLRSSLECHICPMGGSRIVALRRSPDGPPVHLRLLLLPTANCLELYFVRWGLSGKPILWYGRLR